MLSSVSLVPITLSSDVRVLYQSTFVSHLMTYFHLYWKFLPGQWMSRTPSYHVLGTEKVTNILFYLGFMLPSTIFQPYDDGVRMWQGAQCSILECCLTQTIDIIFHPVTLY